MESNLHLYVKTMIEELESLANSYIGAEIETVAFQKLIHLLKDTYKENSYLFNRNNIESINKAKKEVERKKNTYGKLPLKAGYYYADRNTEFKLLKINDKYGELEFDNGSVIEVTSETLNKKRIIFRNMLKDREKDPIIIKLINTNHNYEEMHNKAKKTTRISHCFKCKEKVDPTCAVCYICGWYVCKYDGFCGCHYGKIY
jgi:hypothetical protein